MNHSEGPRAPIVRAVLFDLDGTLIDTIALIMASFRHATREVLGECPPDEVLLRNIGVPLRVQMEEFAQGRSEELLVAYREYNARIHDDMVSEYPGTEAALDSLRDLGIPLGVVTSKSRQPAEHGLELFGLRRYFDVVLTSDDTAIHKPDPFPLLEAARRLGIPAQACAYVGDSPHDMTAALGADMTAIAALWGPFPERVLEPGPAYAIPAISALPDVVRGDGSAFATCLADNLG